jgi:hypothetical protein
MQSIASPSFFYEVIQTFQARIPTISEKRGISQVGLYEPK